MIRVPQRGFLKVLKQRKAGLMQFLLLLFTAAERPLTPPRLQPAPSTAAFLWFLAQN